MILIYYRRTADGTENKAVDNLNATILGGQKVGLMGRTGRYTTLKKNATYNSCC